MALAINDVMDAIGRSIDGVGGLYTYSFPPDSAQPPFAYLDMPQTITYDGAMGRGMDRTSIQIHVGVTGTMSHEARIAIGLLAAATGPNSLKAAIENAELGAMVRVVSAEFAQIALASGNYAGLVLTLDVAA